VCKQGLALRPVSRHGFFGSVRTSRISSWASLGNSRPDTVSIRRDRRSRARAIFGPCSLGTGDLFYLWPYRTRNRRHDSDRGSCL